LTLEGHARQRHAGDGATGALRRCADTLGFMLGYQKTKPLQTAHAFHLGLRQPQTHYGMHPLVPILRATLDAWGLKPARAASRMAHHHLALAGEPDGAMDGPARRRPRPADATTHKAHDRGKKKPQTDKHRWLVNAHTGKGV
jgi:hypothetical protein